MNTISADDKWRWSYLECPETKVSEVINKENRPVLKWESPKCHIKLNFQVGHREVGFGASHWLDWDAKSRALFIPSWEIILSYEAPGYTLDSTAPCAMTMIFTLWNSDYIFLVMNVLIIHNHTNGFDQEPIPVSWITRSSGAINNWGSSLDTHVS